MGNRFTSVIQSWYAKAIFAAILLFAGAIGGVYVGDAYVQKQKSKEMINQQSFPLLVKGDLFPLLNYSRNDGSQGNFEQLIMGKTTLMMFIREGCPYCKHLLEYWNENVEPVLDTPIQVFVCMEAQTADRELLELLKSKQVIIPEQQTYNLIGLKLTPTLFAMDEFGLVTYIKTGFGKSLEKEFFNRFAKKANH